MSAPRIIVVGLDGASPDLVEQLVARGDMPNLARLRSLGVAGPLETTLPPDSWLAWPSFATGAGPGVHGVFSYYAPGRRLTPAPGLVHSGCVRAPTLWDILTGAELTSCVLNVPVTYPPSAIKGCLIAGTPRPAGANGFVFPPEFAQQLGPDAEQLDAVERWREAWRQGGFQAALDHLTESAGRMVRAARRAVAEFRPHLLVVVLVEIDRVQHWTPWPSSPQRGEEREGDSGLIFEAYRLADQALGELVGLGGQETTTFVLSDHGAAECRHSFFPNRFLEQAGFLRRLPLRWHLVRRPRSIRDRIRRLHLRGIADRVGPWSDRKLALPRLARLGLWMEQVDWRNTRAYASLRQCRDGIFVNLKGREPNGVVDPGSGYQRIRGEVIRALRSLQNPHTGEPVLEGIWPREEIYSGPHLEEAPDIVFSPAGGSYLQDDGLDARSCIGPLPEGYGSYHRAPGIWACAGPDITSSEPGRPAHIVDLAPTILYLLDLAIPDHMDGRLLAEHIAPRLMAARPPRRGLAERRPLREQPHYTPEEEREMLDRLRDLGYL